MSRPGVAMIDVLWLSEGSDLIPYGGASIDDQDIDLI